jgi:hypothetical protein
MSYYAFLDDNNVVTEVIAGVHENELIEGLSPEVWYGNLRQQRCVRTSYNGHIRKRYAGISMSYNDELDAFVLPKPYPSWVLNENADWEAPIAKPEGSYTWDEETLSWLEVQEV